MTRTILVPLDGSPFGESALPLAVSLARRSGATLALVHVHDAETTEHAGAPAHDLRFDAEVNELMNQDLVGTATRLRNDTQLPITATFLEGLVESTLLERIATTRPWLVVMSSHGRGGLRRMWMGSVADALVRRAQAPVLIVRGTPEASPITRVSTEPVFRNILLPLDGSPMSHIPALAAELGEPGRTTFTLLRVIIPVPTFPAPGPAALMPADSTGGAKEHAEALAQMGPVADVLTQRGYLVVQETTVHSHPATAILAFSAEQPIDLIALSTYGHGGFTRAVLGSVADQVMRSAQVAVLLDVRMHQPRVADESLS